MLCVLSHSNHSNRVLYSLCRFSNPCERRDQGPCHTLDRRPAYTRVIYNKQTQPSQVSMNRAAYFGLMSCQLVTFYLSESDFFFYLSERQASWLFFGGGGGGGGGGG